MIKFEGTWTSSIFIIYQNFPRILYNTSTDCRRSACRVQELAHIGSKGMAWALWTQQVLSCAILQRPAPMSLDALPDGGLRAKRNPYMLHRHHRCLVWPSLVGFSGQLCSRIIRNVAPTCAWAARDNEQFSGHSAASP